VSSTSRHRQERLSSWVGDEPMILKPGLAVDVPVDLGHEGRERARR